MLSVDCRSEKHWLDLALTAVRREGCCVVTSVLDADLLTVIRPAMYRVREAIVAEIGPERLARAGELGVLRIMMKFEEIFLRLLELPEVLAVVNAAVAPTSV